jgi:hypothetical protein
MKINFDVFRNVLSLHYQNSKIHMKNQNWPTT